MLNVGNILADNSYDAASSVENADSYFARRKVAAWSSLDSSDKEASLIKAADYLRATYAPYAKPVSDSLMVPYNLGQANCELALIASTTDLKVNKKRGKKQVKVGPVEVQYDDVGVDEEQFKFALLLMLPLIVTAQNAPIMKRLFRA